MIEINLEIFHQLIQDTFSLDELKVLSINLDIEYEDLSGDTRQLKTASLIEYMKRRSRLQELLEKCKILRPLTNWDLVLRESRSKKHDVNFEQIYASKSDLLRNIRFTLRGIDAFESDKSLRRIFDFNEELKPWAYRLQETNTRKARADMIVAFLLDKHNIQDKNALILFLRCLIQELDEEDQTRQELTLLADNLESILR